MFLCFKGTKTKQRKTPYRQPAVVVKCSLQTHPECFHSFGGAGSSQLSSPSRGTVRWWEKTFKCGDIPQKNPEKGIQKKRESRIFSFHGKHRGFPPFFFSTSLLQALASGFLGERQSSGCLELMPYYNYLCSMGCLCWS